MDLNGLISDLQNYLAMYGNMDVEVCVEDQKKIPIASYDIEGFDMCETEHGKKFIHINIKEDIDV